MKVFRHETVYTEGSFRVAAPNSGTTLSACGCGSVKSRANASTHRTVRVESPSESRAIAANRRFFQLRVHDDATEAPSSSPIAHCMADLSVGGQSSLLLRSWISWETRRRRTRASSNERHGVVAAMSFRDHGSIILDQPRTVFPRERLRNDCSAAGWTDSTADHHSKHPSDERRDSFNRALGHPIGCKNGPVSVYASISDVKRRQWHVAK